VYSPADASAGRQDCETEEARANRDSDGRGGERGWDGSGAGRWRFMNVLPMRYSVYLLYWYKVQVLTQKMPFFFFKT
jgi:hypothetical protein